MIRCLNCFSEYDESFGMCPFCGATDVQAEEPIHLFPGTTLHHDRYLIGTAVGSGGFGIIYKAFDIKMGNVIAVKEYYPSRLVTRAMGTKDLIVNQKSREEFDYRKTRFLAEARNMAKFGSHRNIPNVFEFFEENNTAYIVMELLEGTPLNEFLKMANEPLDKDLALYITNEVGQALISMHKEGIIHRDVAPDNIFLCDDKEMKVKLLDLGAAKLADSDDNVVDIILKPGYSPVEQYDKRKNIDASTDVYALGATLYVMLTNVKPDESTNRKIQDKVAPPSEIVSNIDENLSNAIMKAMAIDKHLRFGNVAEFLKAINGEKKVVPLKKEKKMRKLKQIGGIAAAVILIGVCAFVVSKLFNKQWHEANLDPVTLTVWYKAEAGSDKVKAMEYIKEDFESKPQHKGVVLDLKAIDPEDYDDEIEKAALKGKLPNIFESTDCDETVLDNCIELDNVIKSSQADKCLFLDEYYDEIYEDKKQVPLAFEAPVAMVITNGPTYIDYSGDTFTSIEDFGEVPIAWDRNHADLVSANFEIGSFYEEDTFLNNTDNYCPVLITSSTEIDDVHNALAIPNKAVYLESDNSVCAFTFEWSISNGNNKEITASERLLSWMLGQDYQDKLMLGIGGSGELPLCEEIFDKLCESDDNYYSGLEKIKDDLTFEEISIPYLPEPLEVKPKDSWAEFDDDPSKNLENFIRNAYIFLLDREVDQDGFKNWYQQLIEGTITPEDFIRIMIGTGEFTDRNLSNEDYITAMYKTILYRVPDEEGLNAFVEIINNGSATRESVLDIFFGSDEWVDIKAKMGV